MDVVADRFRRAPQIPGSPTSPLQAGGRLQLIAVDKASIGPYAGIVVGPPAGAAGKG